MVKLLFCAQRRYFQHCGWLHFRESRDQLRPSVLSALDAFFPREGEHGSVSCAGKASALLLLHLEVASTGPFSQLDPQHCPHWAGFSMHRLHPQQSWSRLCIGKWWHHFHPCGITFPR